jgi:hypothetical protein
MLVVKPAVRSSAYTPDEFRNNVLALADIGVLSCRR